MVGVSSLKQKCRHDLTAIELLLRLETEVRPATAEEQRVLVRYVAWGGLPQVFDSYNDEWSEEREPLPKWLSGVLPAPSTTAIAARSSATNQPCASWHGRPEFTWLLPATLALATRHSCCALIVPALPGS